AGKQIGEIAVLMVSSPRVLIQIAFHLTYPLLIALSAALLVMLLLSLCWQLPMALSRFVRRFPISCRGTVGVTLFAVLIIAPLFFGPLWTLFAWGSLVGLTLPDRRWLVAMAGFSLALWGFLIPIRENFSGWLSDPGI